MTEEISEHAPWLSTVSPNELRRIIEALYRVHRLVAAMTDLNTLLERIIEESRTVARAEASSLMLYDHVSDELYFEVALGEQGDQQALKREIRLAPGQGIAGAAAQSRESINVPDVTREPQWAAAADEKSKFQTRNLLAVPLLDKDKLIGVIEVLNKIDGEAFTDTDKHVMEMFSALAATAIANARLIEDNL
ncbi:MAG: GAF domain-containing protein, partial [Candidatus Hydrogenedentes bacterium]|nr:GAF domain-containing protein [Candidatus Hydrogenedentota bacterium]